MKAIAPLLLFALSACDPTVRMARIPPELTHCADDPAAPSLPEQDWSTIEAAKAVAQVRDALMIDYVLGLRTASGDCRAKVAGVRAFGG